MGRRGFFVAVAGGLAGIGWLLALASSAQAECSVETVQECTPPTSSAPPVTVPPLPTTTTEPPRPRPDARVVEARLLELVNGERRARGLGVLARRADVDAIARRHGERMAAEYRIWHNDEYFTAATKRAIGASFVGENVAKNSSIEDMHLRLMNSPHHRDNILDRRFSQVGIGVGVAPNGELFATEDFLTPVAAAAPVSAAAPAAAKPAPSTTTTVAAEAPADEPVELAMPGPMDMAGVVGPALPGRGPGGGRSGWFLLLCLAAMGAIGAPLRVCFSRYALRDPSVGGRRRVVDPVADQSSVDRGRLRGR